MNEYIIHTLQCPDILFEQLSSSGLALSYVNGIVFSDVKLKAHTSLTSNFKGDKGGKGQNGTFWNLAAPPTIFFPSNQATFHVKQTLPKATKWLFETRRWQNKLPQRDGKTMASLGADNMRLELTDMSLCNLGVWVGGLSLIRKKWSHKCDDCWKYDSSDQDHLLCTAFQGNCRWNISV